MKQSIFKKNSIVAVAAAMLIFATLPACQTKSDKGNLQSASTTNTKPNNGIKIAYVNLDTLEAKYTFFKEKKAEFESRQEQIQTTLEADANKLQNKYLSFRKKLQAGTLSQSEAQTAQKSLTQMQQNLAEKKQNLTDKLLKDQDAFNTKLKTTLDSFLTKYNQDKKYDFILSYMDGGVILQASPKYDITQDVINGLNKAYTAENKKK